jgi:hypothetical protein
MISLVRSLIAPAILSQRGLEAVLRPAGNHDRGAASHLDDALIGVPERGQQDYLVALIKGGETGVGDGLLWHRLPAPRFPLPPELPFSCASLAAMAARSSCDACNGHVVGLARFIASVAACRISSGVSKSGSPMVSDMTSAPAALSSRALPAMARMAPSAMLEVRAESEFVGSKGGSKAVMASSGTGLECQG